MSLALGLTAALLLFGGPSPAQQSENWLERALTLYWNGEYEGAVKVLRAVPFDELAEGERIEVHKYLGFSYIALGDNASAEVEFTRLLSLDSAYHLDPALVSPKIIERFNLAREKHIAGLFNEGKAAYQNKDYLGAAAIMDKILRVDPGHQLAKEYGELAAEHIALTEKAASLQSQETQAKRNPPPPAEEPDDRVYQLSSDITPPVLAHRVSPVYPPVDRQTGVEGTVVLLIVVEKDGTVKEARAIRSVNPRIDKAALEAVKQWRYRPAQRAGKPVRVSSVVGITFDLVK